MSLRTSRTISMIGSALALSWAVVACGEDDTSPDSAPTPTIALTAAEFRAEADSICATADAELNDAFADLDAFTDGELTAEQRTAAEGALANVADIVEKQGKDIDALGEPASLTPAVTAFVNALRDGAAQIREDGLDLYLSAADDPLADAIDAARSLGLEICSAEG